MDFFAQTTSNFSQKIKARIAGTVFKAAYIRLLRSYPLSQFFLRDILLFEGFQQ